MEIFIVGGAVRDRLMGLEPKDHDFVVVGSSPREMAAKGFRQVGVFPVFLHPETQDEYALARTERKSGVGYSGFSTETQAVTLLEDLSRRDLTINAMAMDDNAVLIDPYGGQADVTAKILRHVSKAFADDPLRVLRVARFLARFGPQWAIAQETTDLMREMVNSGTLDELTQERVWLEVEKGLNEPHPELMLGVLSDLNILSRPSFAEYSGAVALDTTALRRATSDKPRTAVLFALAFPRRWSPAESKGSRIPQSVREVGHCLALGLSIGLGRFKTLPPAEKVKVLVDLDAFRQKDRMLAVVEALEYLHVSQAPSVLAAMLAVNSIDNTHLLAGLTNGAVIKAKIAQARIDAVATAGKYFL